MSRSFWKTLLALAALVAALGSVPVAATTTRGRHGGTPATSEESGGEPRTSPSSSSPPPPRDNIKAPDEGKKGGKLTVLSAGDVDYMDPQKTYYTYAIGIINAIHRGLYAYPPAESSRPCRISPRDVPEISEDRASPSR